MEKKKSFKNALNNISSRIEPCGTPEIMSLKSTNFVDMNTLCAVF